MGVPVVLAACVVAVANIGLFLWATRTYWREDVTAPANLE